MLLSLTTHSLVVFIKHFISATHLQTLQRNTRPMATHLPMLQRKLPCGNTLVHTIQIGKVSCICDFKVVFSNPEKHSVYSLAKVILSPWQSPKDIILGIKLIGPHIFSRIEFCFTCYPIYTQFEAHFWLIFILEDRF